MRDLSVLYHNIGAYITTRKLPVPSKISQQTLLKVVRDTDGTLSSICNAMMQPEPPVRRMLRKMVLLNMVSCVSDGVYAPVASIEGEEEEKPTVDLDDILAILPSTSARISAHTGLTSITIGKLLSSMHREGKINRHRNSKGIYVYEKAPDDRPGNT